MKVLAQVIGMWMTLSVTCAGVELMVQGMSFADMSAINLSDAVFDHGWVAPVSTGLAHLASDPTRAAQLDALVAQLALWAPAQDVDPAIRVAALLNAVALVDLGRGACEGDFAWTIFDRLQRDPERAVIMQATAQIAVGRAVYTPVNCLLPLHLTTTETTERVQARMALYARKLLGRFLGSLPLKPQ